MKFMYLAPLAFVAVSATASADGLYVLGEVTHSSNSLKRNAFDNTLADHGAVGLTSSDKGGSNQWRLQGGYRFNENLAVEAGYIDFGTAKYSAAYTGGGAQGKLKAGGVDIAGVVSLPVSQNFSVFGKAGLVAAKVKASLAADGPASAASDTASSTVVRPLAGIGGSFKLNQNVSLRAEIDHVSDLGKSSTGKMSSNMVSMGLAYDF